MSIRRAIFGLCLLVAIATWAHAQPGSGDASPLPEGARLRLGNSGLALGEAVIDGALSPDGKYLAAATRDSILVYDRQTGKKLAQVSGNVLLLGLPSQIVFSPGSKVMAYCDSRNVVLAEIPTGQPLHQLDVGEAEVFRGQGISFSADGKVVAAGMIQPSIKLKPKAMVWDVATGKTLATVEVAQNASCFTALSPDGKMLATWGKHILRMVGEDQKPELMVQLWDAAGKELGALKVDRADTQILGAAFSGDGKTIAVASGIAAGTADRSCIFHVFDVESAKELRRFTGRRGRLGVMRFSPDGKMFVAGGLDGAVQAWNAVDGKRIELASGPKGRLLSLAFPAEGQVVALAMAGPTLAWWDARSGKVGNAAVGHQGPVLAVAYAADGKTLTSAGIDGKVVTWDTAAGAILRQLALVDEGAAGTRFNTLALSPDARFAATWSVYPGSVVRLWSLATGQSVSDFEAAKGGSFGLSFGHDGRRLVAANSMKQINIWNTESGQDDGQLTYASPGNAMGGAAPRIVLAPDGKAVALAASMVDPNSGVPSAKIMLLDAATGKERYAQDTAGSVAPARPGATTAAALAFSLDSKLLALPGPNQTVLIVRADSAKEYRRMEVVGGSLDITAIAFSPDGRTVAVAHSGARAPDPTGMSGAEPPMLELCELASGKSRVVYKGHQGTINSLAFSSDGLTLASGSSDTTVLLWDVGGTFGQKAVALNAADTEAAWALLAKLEAQPAFVAQRKLIASPGQTVPFLKKHLSAAKPPVVDAKQIVKWVNDLDSETFATRDEAYQALDKLGPPTEAALRQARAGKISLEMRRRIDDLLEKLERGNLTPEELQAVRAVEVLERIATPEARELLAALGEGADTAALTQEAKKALGRIKN